MKQSTQSPTDPYSAKAALAYKRLVHTSPTILLSCLLALVMAACGQKSPKEAGDIPAIAFHVDKSKKMASLFNEYTFIQLETTDDCVLPVIKRVIDINDTLVVLSNANDIFTFERNTGKLIGRISSQGEGPEEYVEASDIFADANGQIGIVDRLRGEVKYFTTKGSFSKAIKIGHELAWMNNVELASDGSLLVSNQLTGGYPPQRYAYTLIGTGKGGKRASSFDEFAPVTVGDYSTAFASKPATVCGDEVHFLKFLNDTLFSYRNGEIKPMFRLQTHVPLPSHKVVAKQGEYDIIKLATLCKNGNFFIGFDGIYETDSLVLLVTNVPEQNGFYWIDKNTNKGYICPGISLMSAILANVAGGRCIYNPVGSSATELVQSINPDDAPLMKEVLTKKKVKPFDNRLPQFLDTVDPEGNPCLFIYAHK